MVGRYSIVLLVIDAKELLVIWETSVCGILTTTANV